MYRFLVFFILFFSTTSNLNASSKISLQLLWKHQFEFAGFYIAKEKGFYKNEGLDVDIKEYKFGINIVDDVISNRTNIGIGRSSLILEKLRGKDISLLFSIYQTSPYVLVSKKRDDLKTIDDFKNKKIMLSEDLESIAAISAMMKMRDIKKSDYMELPHSFHIEDIITGKTDIMTTYMSNEPYNLIKKGIEYTIFNPKDYGFNFYADLVFTSKEYLNKNEERINKFKQASIKGWEYAFENIDETIELILEKYNSQNKSADALKYEALILKELAFQKNISFGNLDEQRVKEIANLYKLLGITKKSNDNLENLIHKDLDFIDYIKLLFTIKNLIIVSIIIFILIFLALYKQYILKKQNLILEEAVNKKTKELKALNSSLEQKVFERTKELENLNKNLKEAKEEALLAKYQAEEATKAKSSFLANMSHEIRTPMTGILGFVELLASKETDPERKKQFNIIKNSSNTLLTIINDILDFSKIENGKLDIESHPSKIVDFLQEIKVIFDEIMIKKNITFEFIIGDNIPNYILIDEVRVKQVILNLLNNAVKFTNNNGLIIFEAIYDKNEEKLFVTVSDTGIGISKDKLEHIFEAFSQEDVSITRKFGGTGLGLTISSKLVSLMGGSLKVESKVGEGSRFYFDIKSKVCKDIDFDREIDKPKIDKKTDLNGHILIVDDNETNQILLKAYLERLSFTYDLANDGIEAVEMYKQNFYDVILMDENMPNMNGIEATKVIRNIEKENKSIHTPIVALTANALKEDRVNFLNAGMDEYISKPYTEKDIESVLNIFLSQKIQIVEQILKN